MENTKNLQAKEKNEVTGPAEQTKTGPTFIPDVDIFETEGAIVLLADMPGVKAEDLHIDLKDDTLSIVGDVAPFEGPNEDDLVIEYEIGRFARQFHLTEVIDQEKIEANLNDGVLRLVMPKAEKAVPKKIAVKAA